MQSTWHRAEARECMNCTYIGILLVTAALALAGCANLNTVHHQFADSNAAGTTKARAISVDVYQRFLEMAYNADQSDPDYKLWKMCAEPSPDALATYGTAGGASGGTSRASGSLAVSTDQSGAAFGLRTQSVTILRDMGFRLCEGFLNHSLDPQQFATLHRRLQNIVVANLAIEQLTGYARPTVVALGTNATSQAGGALNEIQKQLDLATKDLTNKSADSVAAHKNADSMAQALTAANSKASTSKNSAASAAAASKATPADSSLADAASKADAQAKADQKGADDAKVAADDASTKASASDTAVADAKANVAQLKDARDAARSTLASATSAPVQISSPQLPPQATSDIAKAIQAIVADVVDRDYTKDTCLDFVTGIRGSRQENASVTKGCLELLQAVAVFINAKANDTSDSSGSASSAATGKSSSGSTVPQQKTDPTTHTPSSIPDALNPRPQPK